MSLESWHNNSEAQLKALVFVFPYGLTLKTKRKPGLSCPVLICTISSQMKNDLLPLAKLYWQIYCVKRLTWTCSVLFCKNSEQQNCVYWGTGLRRICVGPAPVPCSTLSLQPTEKCSWFVCWEINYKHPGVEKTHTVLGTWHARCFSRIYCFNIYPEKLCGFLEFTLISSSSICIFFPHCK